jgi:hypothetical protein
MAKCEAERLAVRVGAKSDYTKLILICTAYWPPNIGGGLVSAGGRQAADLHNPNIYIRIFILTQGNIK